ncbi:MAG: hypothetical protein R2744_06285 [Bacteroidales bacterium]
MGKDNIEKVLRWLRHSEGIVTVCFNFVHYRRVIVLGRENIKAENHNIFAPNHQNA